MIGDLATVPRLRSNLTRSLKTCLSLAAVCLTAACAGTGYRSSPMDAALEKALTDLAHPKAPIQVPGSNTSQQARLDGALLNGLTQSDITTVLGAPTRVRVDPPAHVWQYNLPQCFVDVFLYDDGFGPRVVYVQERPRQIQKITPGLCLYQAWDKQRNRLTRYPH